MFSSSTLIPTLLHRITYQSWAIVACCITFELILFCGTSDTFHTMFAFACLRNTDYVVIMIGVNKVIYKIPSSFNYVEL